MTDIARIVIFKKENGEEFTFDDKYVQLTSLEKKKEQNFSTHSTLMNRLKWILEELERSHVI